MDMPPKKRTKQVVIEPEPQKQGKPFLLILLLVAMALSAAYLLVKKAERPMVQEPPKPEEQVAPENVIDKVKRHILVNEGENPYIATITNLELVKQKNPSLYQNAEDGDKVFIWSDKVVVYSERRDRIVAVATADSLIGDEAANIDAANTGDQAEVDEAEALANSLIEIRNGSRITGEASKLKKHLIDEGFTITQIGDASRMYQGGLQIINLAGEATKVAIEKLEKDFGVSATTTYPLAEAPSKADILLIIGRPETGE